MPSVLSQASARNHLSGRPHRQGKPVSTTAALLHATVARRASGGVTITGRTLFPGHIRRAIHGSGKVFGSPTRRGNWIVLPDGRVSGATTAEAVNQGRALVLIDEFEATAP